MKGTNMFTNKSQYYEVLWFGNGSNLTNPMLVRAIKRQENNYTICLKNSNEFSVNKSELRNVSGYERYFLLAFNQLLRQKAKEPVYSPVHQDNDVKKVLWFNSTTSAELVTILEFKPDSNEVSILKVNSEITTVNIAMLRNLNETQVHIFISYNKLIKQKIKEQALELFVEHYPTVANNNPPANQFNESFFPVNGASVVVSSTPQQKKSLTPNKVTKDDNDNFYNTHDYQDSLEDTEYRKGYNSNVKEIKHGRNGRPVFNHVPVR